jgi:hypothetical protein
LGIRSGATPRGRIYSNPTPSALLRKADISTLLGIGHFYFALTQVKKRLRLAVHGDTLRGKRLL